MKKILALLCAAVLLLSAAVACGKEDTEEVKVSQKIEIAQEEEQPAEDFEVQFSEIISDTQPFDVFADYGASLHIITGTVSDSDIVSGSNLTMEDDIMTLVDQIPAFVMGTYIYKGDKVYNAAYNSCNMWEYDIDSDGENELVFYASLNDEDYTCTYYVIEKGDEPIVRVRYSRAWAVDVVDGQLVLDIQVEGVDEPVEGKLVCSDVEGERVLTIDAGKYVLE